MAAKGHSYAEKFSRWQLLITNGKTEVPDIPHVAEDLAALEQKLGDVLALESRQEDLRSQARNVGKQIRDSAREGEKIRARLGATLKGKYGFDSESLVKYGFRPRPQTLRRRAKQPAEQPPEETPNQTSR